MGRLAKKKKKTVLFSGSENLNGCGEGVLGGEKTDGPASGKACGLCRVRVAGALVRVGRSSIHRKGNGGGGKEKVILRSLPKKANQTNKTKLKGSIHSRTHMGGGGGQDGKGKKSSDWGQAVVDTYQKRKMRKGSYGSVYPVRGGGRGEGSIEKLNWQKKLGAEKRTVRVWKKRKPERKNQGKTRKRCTRGTEKGSPWALVGCSGKKKSRRRKLHIRGSEKK